MKIVTKIIMILSVFISFIINAPVFAANCSTAPDMLEEILKRGKIRNNDEQGRYGTWSVSQPQPQL